MFYLDLLQVNPKSIYINIKAPASTTWAEVNLESSEDDYFYLTFQFGLK